MKNMGKCIRDSIENWWYDQTKIKYNVRVCVNYALKNTCLTNMWLYHTYSLYLAETRNAFLPEASFGLRVLSLPASVRPSVRPSVTKFVRAMTHYPFKLGSPNLDHRCKRPWLRSLLFCGTIDLDLQGQIALQNQNLPHFELVYAITHHQLKLQFPDLEQECILALFRSRPILGFIDIYLQF